MQGNIKLYYTAIFLLATFLVGFSGLWSGVWADASCAKNCHIITPYVDNTDDSSLLVSNHIEAGLTCIDCHEQDEQTRAYEQKIWNSGEYDDPMFPREYEADFCFRCHEPYDELAKRTKEYEEKWDKNPHASHLDEPDCYECHRIHRPSTFACAECHPANWEERLPIGWATE